MGTREYMANHNFGRKARSWFEAFLNNYLGCRHATRVIIQYGVSQPAVLTHLVEALSLMRTGGLETKS